MGSITYSASRQSLLKKIRLPKHIGWWMLFLLAVSYGVFAFYMGIIELLFQLGLISEVELHSVPPIFVFHAVAGAVVLVSGTLQFNRSLFTKKRRWHRISGRVYVVGVWISSIAGLWQTVFFDVPFAAKITFGTAATLWFSTTTFAFLLAMRRQFKQHREWMIRSYALSLFFMTFSFWVDGLASTGLPESVSYPLAVFLSWSLNLLAAETWIRRSRIGVVIPQINSRP